MSEVNLKVLEHELSEFLHDHCNVTLDLEAVAQDARDEIEKMAVSLPGSWLCWRLPPYLSKSGIAEYFYPEDSIEDMTVWSVTWETNMESAENFSATKDDALLIAEIISTESGVSDVRVAEVDVDDNRVIQDFPFEEVKREK